MEAIRIIAIVLFIVFVLISGKKISQFMSYGVFMQTSSIYPIFELIPRSWKKYSASRPIGKHQSVWCVSSTLTLDLECGLCYGIRSLFDRCRFFVLPLHREVGDV